MATFGERIKAAIDSFSNPMWNEQMMRSTAAPQSIYVGVNDMDKARIDRYQLLWRYYHGEHRKHLKSRMTPTGPGPDDNVTVNISRRVVNKGAAFLFGENLDWELTEGEESPLEKELDKVWVSDEHKMSFLNELAINGGVTGDFYVQIQPSQITGAAPRLINLNPAIIFPTWNPSDIDEVYRYELRWREGPKIKRTLHVIRDDGQWDIFTEMFEQGRWFEVADTYQLWPWEWPAIIHGKNLPNPNEFYGLSDLEDADLNDAINAASSNINRVIRIFAHPIVWGRMFAEKDLDVSKIAISGNKEATLEALELAKDMGSAQEYVKFLRTMFSEVTQVPENDPDRMAIGAQSGFALKVLYHEMVQKTQIKRALYGKEIIELNRRCAEMIGKGKDNRVKLTWQDPLPADERSEVASDGFDLENGLASKQSMSMKRGYDWDKEQERKKVEQAQLSREQKAMVGASERIVAAQGGVVQPVAAKGNSNNAPSL